MKIVSRDTHVGKKQKQKQTKKKPMEVITTNVRMEAPEGEPRVADQVQFLDLCGGHKDTNHIIH